MPDLSDLNEYARLCRDSASRSYVEESIACYYAGAYRASVVSCWTAVVFDYIHKLRELELAGDDQARAKLEEFNRAIAKGDVAASLAFERQLIKSAQEFEFVSSHEAEDLGRLLTDRNRCAHPAMHSERDAYGASAEQARLHIRNSVTALMQHPPVQGKAALQRLQSEVKSENFPQDEKMALSHFEHGPLRRARQTLVRNFALSLVRHLLGKDAAPHEYGRFVAAFGAVLRLHPVVVEREVLTPHLAELVRNALLDGRHLSVLAVAASVPQVLPWLDADNRAKLEACVTNNAIVETRPAAKFELVTAARIDFLSEKVTHRIARMNDDELASCIATISDASFAQRAVMLYTSAGSFDQANGRAARLILPLVSAISAEQAQRVLIDGIANDQVLHSFQFGEVLLALVAEGKLAKGAAHKALSGTSKDALAQRFI